MFGWTADEEASFAVLDAYVEAGGNFIDTADSYGRRGAMGSGASETIIGRWMAARGNRDQLVIATKVGMREGLEGLSRATIMAAVDGSLERLQTDVIDVYYAHADDSGTPLEETLAAFAELIAAGKVRHVAASNYTAARLAEALALAGSDAAARFVALQPHYNLLELDSYEGELQDLCAREGLGCVPYFALARGFLTGKYRREEPLPEGPRAAGVRDSYFNERGFAVLDEVTEIAREHDVAPSAVALAWLRAQPTVVAPIASATSVEQLSQLLPMASLRLSDEELQRLRTASAS